MGYQPMTRENGKGVKMPKTIKWALILLGAELFREWIVLRFMGFEPGRFVNWIRSDEIGTRGVQGTEGA